MEAWIMGGVLMHSRTALPSWTELERRTDEIGERIREIEHARAKHMAATQSQNAE